MYKHILLPTDGSEAAMRAVRQGAELAARVGAEVTVMTVVEHLPTATGIIGSGYLPELGEEEKVGQQWAKERLAQAEQAVRAQGLNCRSMVVSEMPVYRAILNTAQTVEADLIIMGTRGLGLVERVFIGSETQRVLTHTTLPVLTLH